MDELQKIIHSDPIHGWDTLYQNNTTPWSKAQSSPALLKLVSPPLKQSPQLQNDCPPIPQHGYALVPGCGIGNDVFTLAVNSSRKAIGIDLSSTVIQKCKQRQQEYFSSEQGNNKLKEQIDFVVGDFFSWKPVWNHHTPIEISVIYDYTFLCAIEPSKRPEWAKTMGRLLTGPHAELITLIFPLCDKEGGPPYAMSFDLVEVLLAKENFHCIYKETCQESLPGREGMEMIARWRKKMKH
eukprot:Sdes_comp20748_c0_seq1m16651